MIKREVFEEFSDYAPTIKTPEIETSIADVSYKQPEECDMIHFMVP